MDKPRSLVPYEQTLLITGAVMGPPLQKALMPAPFNSQPWLEEGIATQTKVAEYAVRRAKPGEVILLGNNLSLFSKENNEDPKETHRKEQVMGEWLRKLSAFTAFAEEHKVNVVVMTPIPFFKKVGNLDVNSCIPTWFRRQIPERCFASGDHEDIKSSITPINKKLYELGNKHKNLFIFDPFTTICPGKVCKNHSPQGRLYTDHPHLNNRGSSLLAMPLLSFLKQHNL